MKITRAQLNEVILCALIAQERSPQEKIDEKKETQMTPIARKRA